jgi:hypothetical protein
MTKGKGKAELVDVKELLESDEDFLRTALQALVQAALEAEVTETIGAAKGERSETRLTYRSGYYSRALITRVGTLELRVPQDRAGRFSTELFERYQRSEKALVGTLAEMYVQGVSTRRACPREGGGQGGNRSVVRAQLLGLGDQLGEQIAGRSAAPVRRAAVGRGFPLPDYPDQLADLAQQRRGSDIYRRRAARSAGVGGGSCERGRQRSVGGGDRRSRGGCRGSEQRLGGPWHRVHLRWLRPVAPQPPVARTSISH